MEAIYIPPQLYKYSKLEAACGYWRACLDVGLPTSVPLVTTLVAHGALESGNFQVGCWCNNPGNIKAGPTYVGRYTCITLNEMLKEGGRFVEVWFAPEGRLTASPKKGGVHDLKYGPKLAVPPGHGQTRMRAFDTLDDGLENKIRFLMSPAWAAVLVPAQAGNTGGFVRAIRARHYFTAYPDVPLDKQTPYERDVISLAATYRPFVEQASALGGVLSEPAKIVSIAPPPELAVKFDHTRLDDATIAQIEDFHELFFDAEMHAPRKHERENIS